MKKAIWIAAVVALVATTGIAGAGEKHAEYGGHCPVAYAMMNKAVKGDPKVSSDFAGKHYVFANSDAKKMFDEDPMKFQVAYDGYCATAASMGKKVDADPAVFTTEGGVTYLFSSAKAKEMFDAKKADTIAAANEKWGQVNPAYGGHCPVAYAMMNKPVMGEASITGVYHGHRINFAAAEAKTAFEADPKKFKVAYGGHCATAMSMGKWYDSDPTVFVHVDGVTYLFSSEKAKKMFEKDAAATAKKADEQWAAAH